MSEDRAGRLDLLIKDGFGLFAERLGIRRQAQPVIDRFVEEQIQRNRVPVTPVEIFERLGILKNPKKGKR